MALVVFLRGVNVGGHRAFRPSQLAADLEHLGCVNIGAAGTFVIRRPVPLKHLRRQLEKRLPFVTTITICHGENITRLVANQPDGDLSRGAVRFVSILPNKTYRVPVPLQLPPRGKGLVRVLRCDGRFVVGEYRKDMRTIGYLGKLDELIGAPLTTRNWNTILLIAKALSA